MIHKRRDKNRLWCGKLVEWNTLTDQRWKQTNCKACFEEVLKYRTRTSYDTAIRWYEIKKEKGELI